MHIFVVFCLNYIGLCSKKQPFALQKTAFCIVKCALLWCKTWPFALSDFPLYFLVWANLLIYSALSVKRDFTINLSFRLLFSRHATSGTLNRKGAISWLFLNIPFCSECFSRSCGSLFVHVSSYLLVNYRRMSLFLCMFASRKNDLRWRIWKIKRLQYCFPAE